MASKLLLCFTTANSGFNLFRGVLNQLPFVTNWTTEFAQEFFTEDSCEFASTDIFEKLIAWLSTLAERPGQHLLIVPVYKQFPEELLKAVNVGVSRLSIHPVLLIRHPFEVAGHDENDMHRVRRLCDWCTLIALQEALPNCHLINFDELLADPVSCLHSWFQTIPDSGLLQVLNEQSVRDRLLIQVQPARKNVFASGTVLQGDPRYRIFSNLYAYLQVQRLYRAEQLEHLMRLVLSLFSSEKDKLFQQAMLVVKKGSNLNELFFKDLVDDEVLDVNLTSWVQQLLPKQRGREELLKIAEKARKDKRWVGASVIYRFLLLIDPQSPAALTGLALTLNDMKQWGEAISLWEALSNLLEAQGTLPNTQQRNGHNACIGKLTDDIGFLLKKPTENVYGFREHIIKKTDARVHAAFMRTWSYLNKKSGQKSRALLVNDTRTQINIGCYATTNELLRGFAAEGVLIDHTLTLSELSALADVLFFPDSLEVNSKFDVYLYRFASWPEFHAVRKLIAMHKTLIFNGEGSFYDRQRKGLILCILMVYAKEYCDCNVYCINQSVDLHDDIMRSWVYRAFQCSDYISVREHISLSRFPEEFHAFDIDFVPDAAFRVVANKNLEQKDWFHGFDQLVSGEVLKPYVVVSGTSAIFRGDREGFSTDHVVDFNNLLKSIRSMGLNVVLLASDNTDYKLLRQAALELKFPIVSPTAHVSALLTLFRDATAFISGRWHTSIIATSAGCPSILGDANFFKTSALHECLEFPWPMFEYRKLDFDKEKILTAIQICQNFAMREKLIQNAQESAVQVQNMIRMIAARI